MALRLAAALCVLSVLPGCGAGVLVVYDGSRQASQEVIGQVLAETRPGIVRDQAADCVIQGMTIREVIMLGTGDSTGPSAAYRSKVAEVRTREGVEDCIAAVPVREG
jgi:hypothetical protein